MSQGVSGPIGKAAANRVPGAIGAVAARGVVGARRVAGARAVDEPARSPAPMGAGAHAFATDNGLIGAALVAGHVGGFGWPRWACARAGGVGAALPSRPRWLRGCVQRSRWGARDPEPCAPRAWLTCRRLRSDWAPLSDPQGQPAALLFLIIPGAMTWRLEPPWSGSSLFCPHISHRRVSAEVGQLEKSLGPFPRICFLRTPSGRSRQLRSPRAPDFGPGALKSWRVGCARGRG